MLIRRCTPTELDEVGTIVNDAAQAYRGVIATDCWKEPYMSSTELRKEVNEGVEFWGAFDGDELVAVMGLQHVGDVALVRHAYTRTARQGSGIGKALLAHVGAQTDRPLLVGTWTAASWAIRFYENHGFRLLSPAYTEVLLRRYWTIPERQIHDSVVLADARWVATAWDSRGEHV